MTQYYLCTFQTSPGQYGVRLIKTNPIIYQSLHPDWVLINSLELTQEQIDEAGAIPE